jgi:small subunit ribosomal protein S2
MSIVSMKDLLESGVHFGHRTHKWHPHMKPYIFTERNGIHIIDLQKTVKALEEAHAIVRDSVAAGGTVLFVGTKRQAQDTIQLEAQRCGMPYVTARWLGGTLTNWRTIRQRINELERLERMRDRGDFARVTKREALGLTRKIERLEMLLGGIRSMVTIPELLFVVDVRREETAIHEANLLGVPIVALVDTNCDPRKIDYIIPSNDDAIRAIKLLVGKIADAVLEGKAMRKDIEEEMPETMGQLFATDTELSDEDLLGEATLAKLQAQRDDETDEDSNLDEFDDEELEDEETESDDVEDEAEDEESGKEVDASEPEEEEAEAEKETDESEDEEPGKEVDASEPEEEEAAAEKETDESEDEEPGKEVDASEPEEEEAAAEKETDESEDEEPEEEIDIPAPKEEEAEAEVEEKGKAEADEPEDLEDENSKEDEA